MNWRAIRAVVRKDTTVVVQSKGVLIPLIIVPLALTIVMPGLLASMPSLGSFSSLPGSADIDRLFEQAPQALQLQMSGLNLEQRMVMLTIVYLLAPMYLILPLMVASVVAADSIVGEKERKTLEALLYTPMTDGELFLAKVLAAWLPAVLVAWGGFIVYSIVANLAAWPVMHSIFFPNTMWLILALWVAPAVAGLGLGFTVAISARVHTYQEAYQIGGIVVIPIVVLIVMQASGLLYFSNTLVWLLGLAFWLVDIALLWFGSRTLRRTQLARRL